MKSQLLIHEEPLQVLPSLAVAVGLNEAIILQQVHYWLKRTEHLMEGKPWVYNSYVQWRDQFPFWSHDTIKRAIQHLEALGVLISTARFNRKPIDKTKWYTINYDRLNAVCGSSTMQNAPTTMQNAPTLAQSAPMDDAKCTDGRCKMHPLPEITAETTSEILNPGISRTRAKTSGAREAKVKRLPRPAYPSGFLAFWACYPPERRAAKPECLKVWCAATLEERTAELCEKVERLKVTSWHDKEPTFIPLMLTWLNQGRYEDELMVMPRAILRGLGAREQRNAEASLRLLEEMKHGRL